MLALFVALAAAPAAAREGVGGDLASLNFCLYGDCEARGTYAADPYNLYNPGTLSVATHMYFPRGVVPSGSYYHVDVGGVDADLEAGVMTLAWAPVAFQVATVYGEAEGPARGLPGIDLQFRTRAVRLAAGMDAERTLGIRGLNVGLAGVVPGSTSDTWLRTRGVTIAKGVETRAVELVPGVHWHGGRRDWFMLGGFLDATHNDVESRGIDPATGRSFRQAGATNIWIARVGASLLPFVPLGLAEGTSPRAAWLSDLRLGIDVEYRDIAVPGETTRSGAVAYFGADVPLLPDALNPLARWVRVLLLGGADTNGGFGIGAGLFGQGPLRFLTCNQAYSDRPLTTVLGPRVRALAVTCSVVLAM